MLNTLFSFRSASMAAGLADPPCFCLSKCVGVSISLLPFGPSPYRALCAHTGAKAQAITANDEPAPTNRPVVKVKEDVFDAEGSCAGWRSHQLSFFLGQYRGLDAQVAPLEHSLAAAVKQPAQRRDGHLGLYHRPLRVVDQVLAMVGQRLGAQREQAANRDDVGIERERKLQTDTAGRGHGLDRQDAYGGVLVAEEVFERLEAKSGCAQHHGPDERAASRRGGH